MERATIAVMTADGRYIAFSSAATNLIANAPLGRQVYLRDTCAGADRIVQGKHAARVDR